MDYLSFDLSDTDDGIITLEAMAATEPARHAAVMAEVAQVLDWARRQFPHTHGPADEGMDWDEDLQVSEDGPWQVVTLTLTGSARFVEALMRAFPAAFPQ